MMTDMEKQEVLFENAFPMTKERYLQLCKHPKAKSAIKRLRKWRIRQSLGLLVALCLVILGIIQKEIILAIFGVSFVLAFSYKLLFQFKHQNKKMYAQIRRSQGPAEWNRITRFYESGIVCKNANVTSITEYHQISHFTDDGQECLLWIGDDYVLRLMHSEFTVGSYEDFVAFIHRKLAENTEKEADTKEQCPKEEGDQNQTAKTNDDESGVGSQ